GRSATFLLVVRLPMFTLSGTLPQVDCRKYPQPPAGDCPNEYKPVCGTDGNIYPHLCVLCYKSIFKFKHQTLTLSAFCH
uniref:Kazal-like domain-containing protein n=1 Tax=Varanus komodoensis TaxID=61221 RepID=A0A8D2L9A2_VARKO